MCGIALNINLLGAFLFIIKNNYMPLPRVLATHLLKHRAIHRAKNGGKKVYIIFIFLIKTIIFI